MQNFQSITDTGILELGPINLLVGRNNTGKSALLRAVYMLQDGGPRSPENIRLGARDAKVTLSSDEIPPDINIDPDEYRIIENDYSQGTIIEVSLNRLSSFNLDDLQGTDEFEISMMPLDGGRKQEISPWSSREPNNLIYPSLARRHTQHYQQQPTRESATTVSPQDSNLVSRIAAFATAQIPEAEHFRNLCKDVLGFTVDILLGQQQNQMQQIGIQVTRFGSIPIESMGSGVSGTLGLLLSLCDAKNKLFLIEEPENDLHPQALKTLLDAVIVASQENQFFITTHSSIVLTKLGAVPSTVVRQTSSDNLRLPSSTYTIAASTEERLDVLRQLGYELADFYLGDGWLIFEESSAERLIRQWLIPWFTPSLGTLRTVAAQGTSRVTALTQAIAEMLVFAHLEQIYKYRAWVIVDGDESGRKAVESLREMFRSWPEDNFICWGEDQFENYYPARFQDKVVEILNTKNKQQKREMKKALLWAVLNWIEEDQEIARSEFAISAADVISQLTSIAENLSAS